MEDTKKRALELVDIIASSKLPWAQAIEEVWEELTKLMEQADPQIRKEIKERIRGLKKI